MKHVLVIAYYFPPMGLSGVQRIVKFVKYLPSFGWQPTVLTIDPHAYFAFDDSMLKDVRHTEIWRARPGRAFRVIGERRTVPLTRERFRGLANRLSQLFFIPDNKIGWTRQAMRFLQGKDLSVFNAVFSTAPPFSNHLLGLRIKHRYGLPLLVDFRDAWVDNPYHVYWTGWHRKRHLELERKVLESSDAIVSNNEFITRLWAERYPGAAFHKRVYLIPQGFDPADFDSASEASSLNVDELHFVYTGVFYANNTPLVLYRALKLLQEEHPDVYNRLRFYMIGYVQHEYRRAAVQLGVEDRFRYCGYLEHADAVAWQQAADVLWLVLGDANRGYQTISAGKAFEYLGSRKPILGIVPDNTIRRMLSGFDHTFLVEPDDVRGLAETIRDLCEHKRTGTLPRGDAGKIRAYDRKVLTGRLGELLDGIARKR